MDSKAILRLAALSTGAAAAFWWGTGLHPNPALTWVAFTLAFSAGSSCRPGLSTLAATAAFAVGSGNLWQYLGFLPPVVRLTLLAIPLLPFAVSVFLFHRLVRKGRPVWAWLAPAATWVTYEFAYSHLSPHSTFGAVAYSQTGFVPWLQLSSVGGIWLMDGLLLLVCAGLALATRPAVALRQRRLFAFASAGLFASVVILGALRAQMVRADRVVRAAAIASDEKANMEFSVPEASEAIVDRYLAVLPDVRRRGADLVVLPEHLLSFRESGAHENATSIGKKLQVAADALRLVIVIGVDRVDGSGVEWNEARLYRPDGDAPITYVKRHLLPGFEARYRAGGDVRVVSVPQARVGLAVCKDMDFPHIGRDNALAGAELLLVPAFDFDVDAWLHSRMAVIRAAEAGLPMVRSAKRGDLTLTSPTGKVLQSIRSNAAPFSVAIADVPLGNGPTVYARFGDWAGWLSCAGFAAVLVAAVTRTRVGDPSHNRTHA